MKKCQLVYKGFILLIFLCLHGTSNAAPFINGGFDIINRPPIAQDGSLPLQPGDTWLPGWTLTAPPAVHVINGRSLNLTPPLSAPEQDQWILFGSGTNSAGSRISQTIDTTPGDSYTVSFLVGQTGAGTASLTLVAAASNGLALASQRVVPSPGLWSPYQMTFVAQNQTTTLSFINSSKDTNTAVALDDVNVIGQPTNRAPVIVYFPASQTVTQGGSFCLTAVASGADPTTIQWVQDGRLLPAATNNTLVLKASDTTSGNYAVVFSNALGVAGASATLTVINPPVIATSPQSQTVTNGQQVTFTATAGGSPAAVQWYLNDTPIVGATNATLSVTANNGTAGKYMARFSNAAGFITTAYASLTVLDIPFTNGGFEMVDGQTQVGWLTPLNPGDTWLKRWTVSGSTNKIQVSQAYRLVPQEGQKFVFFWGRALTNATGVLSQTFSTVVGEPCLVTFALGGMLPTAGRYDWRGVGVTAVILAADGAVLATNQFAAGSNSWVRAQFSFTPQTTNTTIVFTDRAIPYGGAVALDDVKIARLSGPPSILQSPTNQTVAAGKNVTLSATAEGATSTVQWYLGTHAITGATNNTITVTASDATSGSYIAVFNNSFGTATSSPALVTVINPPILLESPVSQTADPGDRVTFTVIAGGSPASFQWYLGNSILPNETNSSLTLTASSITAGSYSVVLTNIANTVTSSVATLQVSATPFVNGGFEIVRSTPISPNSGAVLKLGDQWLPGWKLAGNNGTVSVANGASIGEDPCGGPTDLRPFEGQQVIVFTGGSLSQTFATVAGQMYIVKFEAADTGLARFFRLAVTVTDSDGAILTTNSITPPQDRWSPFEFSFTASTENSTITFTDLTSGLWAACLVLDDVSITRADGAPQILTQPTSCTNNAGETVTFSSVARGSSMTSQWYIGNSIIPGATEPNLTLTASDATSGSYTVVFSNASGSVTSAPAILTVINPPIIVSSPSSQTVQNGGKVTFTVSASGSPFSVQWYNGPNAIPGATNRSITLTASGLTAGTYTAVISNSAGSATSTGAVLTVVDAPFVNGGFEILRDAPVAPGSPRTLSPGDTWLSGWAVEPSWGLMQVANGSASGLEAKQGKQWVLFNAGIGNTGGKLAQTFGTSVGKSYIATFAVAKTSDAVANLTASALAMTASSNKTVLAAIACDPTPRAWTQFQLPFTATTTLTTLEFADYAPSTYSLDLGLDDVTVIKRFGPPMIVVPPVNTVANAGTEVTFSVLADGDSPRFQWYLGASAIPGATNDIFSVTASDATAGDYTVAISNSLGTARSSAAVLSVINPPVVLTSPKSQIANFGDPVTFRVETAGSPCTIQWYFGQLPIDGATNEILIIRASEETVGNYIAVLTNAAGVAISDAAVLTILDIPFRNGSFETVIGTPLTSNSQKNLVAGDTWLDGWKTTSTDNNVLLVNGTGGLTPTNGQQWILFNAGDTPPGASLSQTFTTTPEQTYLIAFFAAQSGPGSMRLGASAIASDGTVLATNQFNPFFGVWKPYHFAFTATTTNTTLVFTDTSSSTWFADLALDDVTISQAAGAPQLIASPENQTANAGASVTFDAIAIGSHLAFQWYLGTTAIAGATNSTLVLTASDALAGSYTMVASNAFGTTTTAPAVLTVIDAPVITSSPKSQTARLGDDVTLTVTATGSPALAQWYCGLTPMWGATNQHLALKASGLAAGGYTVVLSNSAGAATSSVAVLTVAGAPFVNGGFESVQGPKIAPLAQLALDPGETWMQGWTVGGPGGGDIVVVNGSAEGLNSYDGNQWILFNSAFTLPGGTLSQSFSTTIGAPYQVSFALAQLGAEMSMTATLIASDGSVLSSNLYVPPAGAWTPYKFTFTATTTNATLVFKDTSENSISGDIALDAVSVLKLTGAPDIIASPLSQIATLGTPVTFSAQAEGTPSSVQWYVGTNSIPGATNLTLQVIASEQTAGTYSAVFSNAEGTATSTPAVLTLQDTFFNGNFETLNNTIINRNSGLPLNPGDTWLAGWTVGGPGGDIKVFNGVAGDLTPADGQQWILFNTADTIPGGTLSQTFLTSIGATYRVTFKVAMAGWGRMSLDATALADDGTPLSTVSCSARGTWELPFTATTTTTTLVFKDTSIDTWGCDLGLDAVALESSQAAPKIVTSPQSQTLSAGTALTLSAFAVGKIESVQWFKEANAIADATNLTLNLIASDATAGSYTVVFTNTAGAATSEPAILAVIDPPVITQSPESQSAIPRSTVTFTAAVAGSPSDVQWYFNGAAIADATNTSLTILANETSIGGYLARFSNSAGAVDSDAAILTLANSTILNGGFESSIDHWLLRGNPADISVVYKDIGTIQTFEKNQSLLLHNVVPGATLSQGIRTQPGAEYILKFVVGQIGTSDAGLTAMSVASDGSILASNYCVAAPESWSQFQLSFIAKTPVTQVIFSDTYGQTKSGYVALDAVTLVGPPTLAYVPDQKVAPCHTLCITNYAYCANGPVTFCLDTSAPAGARISADDVFSWCPAPEQGSTTNQITVWAIDNGNPRTTNSVTFTVTVGPYIQLSFGSAAVQVGNRASVPVNLISTAPLIDVTFTVTAQDGRFSNWELVPSKTGGSDKGLVNDRLAQFRFYAKDSQWFYGHFASICMDVLSTNSAIIPLEISGLVATPTSDLPLTCVGQPGRLVTISDAPLLEPCPATNSTYQVLLYGIPGVSYGLLSTTNAADPNSWNPAQTVTLTNLFQTIDLGPSTNSLQFFQAVKQ